MFAVPLMNGLEIYFIRGTFISMSIGNLNIADPAMVLQTLLTGVNPYSLLAAVIIPVLMALFFGRVWCGWCCPYTTIMEFIESLPKIGNFLRRKRLKSSQYSNLPRNAVIIILFAIVGITHMPIIYLFSPPAVLSVEAMLLVKGLPTLEILIVLLFILAEFTISYRFVCKYVCPTGTCLSYFTNKKSLSVKFAGSCKRCGKCVHSCPMGIDPTGELDLKLCNNCGLCISCCTDVSVPLKFKL
jgi:ferredoxin-type protein NapH